MLKTSSAISDLGLPSPLWTPNGAGPEPVVDLLASELRLPRPLCHLLAHRGYTSVVAAKEFLRPHRGQIHLPERLAGMAEAVDRLQRLLDGGETVLVHGDYDVDGVCSTALLVRAIRMMGGRAVPFVPHRQTHGYDLTEAGLRAARAAGASVIVTVDCGIVAHDAVDRARLGGIDVIVTDHHTPSTDLPRGLAVINPSRRDCDYPEKGLAGVGVAFKLACALAGAVGFPEERLYAFLDLVALATIADLAPLTGENRALVRWGLHILQASPNPGLRALIRAAGLADGREIQAGQVGYVLSPRLNAAGRMGDAMRAVRLLLTDDEREANGLARELEEENRRRREVDEETLSDALRMIERDFDADRDHGVVLAAEHWHPGVIGIVASRVVERLNRPTVMISVGADEGKGSGRSIPGFHLHDAFVHCRAHLLRFGGHRAAAGCSIRPDRIPAFREAFASHAHRSLTPEDLIPRLRIDGDLSLGEANGELIRALRHLGPFGVGNPTPIFAAYGVRLGGARIVGSHHLKLTLEAGADRLDGIGFGMAGRAGECGGGDRLMDVAFKLEENTWTPSRGGTPRTSIQARVVDFRGAA